MSDSFRKILIVTGTNVGNNIPIMTKGLDMATYVLMTKTGEEEHLAEVLNKTIGAEFFVPKRKKLIKRMDTGWTEQQQVLFPAYVFVRTNDIEQLCAELYKPQVSLGYFLVGKEENGRINAVPEEEMDYIRQLTGDEISKGIKEGSKIRIISGPLKGMETHIKKADPHKKKAWIEIPFLGEAKTVEVTLDIIKVIKD